MLKKCFLFWILIVSALPSFAKHIAGGEMSYAYTGPGTNPNSGKYKITLKLYKDCSATADPTAASLDPVANITIYQTGSTLQLSTLNVPRTSISKISLTNPDPCINNPPDICYEIGFYVFDIELPFSSNGYTISFQRCCRIGNINNVNNSQNVGATYTTTIPGTSLVLNGPINSTPKFNATETVIICKDTPFKFDFSATDPDNDVLEYSFDAAYIGGDINTPNPTSASAPPYTDVPYGFGYSALSPLGPGVTINSSTGLISGSGPLVGIYVITVSVAEIRGGKVINRHRKDLHIKVANCTSANPNLSPNYTTCDGLTLDFKNMTPNPAIISYEWDFGLPGLPSSVLTSANPKVTFPKEGDYPITVITNKGQPCSGTATTIAKVYPGFNVGFKINQTCQGVPYTFTDQSTTSFGTITSRHWDFGNPLTLNDVANTPSSSYTYNSTGTYNVSLEVSNSVGCSKTISQTIVVDTKPLLNVTNDTLICTKDELQLLATGGTGTYIWSPNYMISNVNIPNPIVKPKVATKYNVTLTQAPGCTNTASVFVDVRDFVSLDAGLDTTICLGDSIRLSPISDALLYTWSPSSTVKNPNTKQPWAKPTGTTRYSVTASIGTCQATDGFVVSTVPYPKAFAGADTIICTNGVAQLYATGGEKYLWSPASTLNNNTLQNPLAFPKRSTFYVVGVYSDKGCPKPGYDSVKVGVMPKIVVTATNDTSIVVGQPLQLAVKGIFDPASPDVNEFVRSFSFSWTPIAFLNDPSAWNPVAKVNDDTTFYVKANTNEGCYGTTSVKVKVYKTPPEIFIPTAFTPNGDGLNDQLIPIPVGIKSLTYFKVYNRYGELIFSTNEIGVGWNGIHKGRDQGNEYFVWQVLAIDYLGKPFFKKGQTTLIR